MLVETLEKAVAAVSKARAPKEPPSPGGAAISGGVSVLERPPCPLCGATRGRPVLLGSDEWLSRSPVPGIDPGQKFAVLRCEVCSGRYTSPRLRREHRALAYPKNYPFYSRAVSAQEQRARVSPAELARSRRAFAGRADRLCALMPRPGRLLDLGCGDGFFLDVMRSRGWDVCGIDVEEAVIWYAREVLGIPNVAVGNMEDDPLPSGHFDAITLWGSLQLAYQPHRLLEKIAGSLAPHGVLGLGVSNIKSAGAGLFGSAWYGLGLPRHLVHYTPETLSRLLDWSGLHVAASHFETPRWIVAGSVDAALRSFRPFGKIAKAAAYTASPLVGRSRFGDTMEMYARR